MRRNIRRLWAASGSSSASAAGRARRRSWPWWRPSFMVASFLARVQSPVEDTTSAQFQAFDSHGGTIAAFSLLAAAAFLLLTVPLLYLFRAAEARNPRVRAVMVGFVFIGPILMAGQTIVNWVAGDADLRRLRQAEPRHRTRAVPGSCRSPEQGPELDRQGHPVHGLPQGRRRADGRRLSKRQRIPEQEQSADQPGSMTQASTTSRTPTESQATRSPSSSATTRRRGRWAGSLSFPPCSG